MQKRKICLQGHRRKRRTKEEMIILGIDTAIRKTGYGVIRMDTPGKMEILDCGVIQNKASLPHSECLRRLSGGIRQLLDGFHPEAASIESAFVSKNIKTAMILSLARGAVIAALAENHVPVYEYSPKSAKRAATGNGEASKEQVASIIASICSLDVSAIPNDSTDALALAVCHGSLALRPGCAGMLPKPV